MTPTEAINALLSRPPFENLRTPIVNFHAELKTIRNEIIIPREEQVAELVAAVRDLIEALDHDEVNVNSYGDMKSEAADRAQVIVEAALEPFEETKP